MTLKIQRKEIVSGRPVFVQMGETKKQKIEKSFLSENVLLRKLAPSAKHSKFIDVIKRFGNQFLNFFRIVKPDFKKERLFNLIRSRTASFSASSSMGNVIDQYKEYLKGETCTPSLKKCFEQLEKDSKTLDKARTLGTSKGPKILSRLQSKLFRDFKKMKEGESRILPLQSQYASDASLDGDLFCILTKQKRSHYSLKFVGSGQAMAKLSGTSMPLAGKEKTVRSFYFENIPVSSGPLPMHRFVQEFYGAVYMGKISTPENLSTFLTTNKLFPFQKKMESFEDLTTKSSNRTKLFWEIVQAVSGKAQSDKEQKRIRLRAELLSLFEVFRKYRRVLKPEGETYRQLGQGLEAVSANTLQAYEKGYITQNDLDSICKELNVIQKVLLEAKNKKSSSNISKIRLPSPILKDFKKEIFRPQCDVQIKPEAVSLGQRTDGVKPSQKKPVTHQEQVQLEKYASIKTKEQFLKQLREIYQSWNQASQNRDEILRFFTEIPMELFKERDAEGKKVYDKTNSFFWQFTEQEAKEVMGGMVSFLNSLTDSEVFRQNLNQYQFESYYKMSCLVLFLETKMRGTYYRLYTLDQRFAQYIKSRKVFTNHESKHEIREVCEGGHNFRQINALSKRFDDEIRCLINGIEAHFPKEHYGKDHYKTHLNSIHVTENQLKVNGRTGNRQDFKFTPSKLSHWMRPIKDPFLIALCRQAESRIFYDYELKESEKITKQPWFQVNKRKSFDERLGYMTPEAFRSDPENVFRYFLEDSNKSIKEIEEEWIDGYKILKVSLPHEILKSEPQRFTKEEQIRLLMLLRLQDPQVELMAFMKENRHLMQNPEARNFFYALFFNQSLEKLLTQSEFASYNRKEFIQDISKQIQEECLNLEAKLKEALSQDPIKDLKLTRERFDLLLYYYEMHAHLRQVYQSYGIPVQNFADHKAKITELLSICLEKPEFLDSSSYAARVYLRIALQDEVVSSGDMTEVLSAYAIARGGFCNPANIDPDFEGALQRYWQVIESKLEEDKNLFSGENLQGILDQFCYLRDLPLDGSLWRYQGNGIFTNAKYEVNFRTFEASLKGAKSTIQYLPDEVTNNPLFISTYGDLKGQQVRVNNFPNQKEEIYFFLDSSKTPCQIERHDGQFFMFKKLNVEGGKWLQSLPLDSLKKAPTLLSALEDLKHTDTKFNLINILKTLFKLLRIVNAKPNLPLPFLFDHGLYVDPKNKKEGFALDQNGKASFKLLLKPTRSGLIIDKVIDLRAKKPKAAMKVNQGASTNHRGIEELSFLENKDKMLLWSLKGKLKRVELPRLNLTFNVSGGRLKCKSPGLKGYYVKIGASLAEKKGFPYAIVLEHPDPTKPKKLLLPDADALVSKKESLRPKAYGIGKAVLLMKQIVQLIQALSGITPKMPVKWSFGLDEMRKIASYTAFDIRPYTGEICEREKGFAADLMQLIKQAIKTDQPILALKYLKKIRLEKVDQKTLNVLTAFIQKTDVNRGGIEAALKLKLCFELKAVLKKEKRLSQNLRNFLHEQILGFGKAVLALGRKVPLPLQMNEAERLEFAHIAKQKDPDYTSKHLAPYFVKNGETYDLSAPPTQIQEEAFLKTFKSWKRGRPKVDAENRIKSLEGELKVETPLSQAELSTNLSRLKPGNEEDLLFSTDQVKHLFAEKEKKHPSLQITKHSTDSSCEKVALEELQKEIDAFRLQEAQRPIYSVKVNSKSLKKFLTDELLAKKTFYENALEMGRAKIEAMIVQAQGSEEQLAIYSGKQEKASFDELRIALTQGRLAELQKSRRLPSSLDLNALRTDLQSYFDALSRKNAAEAARRLIEEMVETRNCKSEEQWDTLSTALYRLLTIQRFYCAKEDPRLLAFEAQQFINFKFLDGGLNQMDLLEALLKNPHAIIQAPTGSGKTAVLSVMRSLLKANGKNLVIQKVLPTLFHQTYDKMQEVLGGLYGRSICALQFNLQMPQVVNEIVKEKDPSGTVKESLKKTSIFKGMYLQMLETIKCRGCVLTDYKSLPLLELKFWKIAQELSEKTSLGEPISDLTEEHFTYLRKILLLLEAKGDENMDEFDQPNRPINKIQLELNVGSEPFQPFIIDTALEIFDLLLDDKELRLAEGIQADLSEISRQNCIKRAAEKMAEKLEPENAVLRQKLIAYFLGQNEEVLNDIEGEEPSYKDKVALCKDQLSVYLRLTLRGKSPSRYDRSDDGKRTIPCHSGEKHEAKFGTILEQIDYTIQDYLLNGIKIYDLKEWFTDLKNKYDEAEKAAQKPLLRQLEAIFKGRSFAEVESLISSAESLNKLIAEINSDRTKIKFFLKLQLSRLKTSGIIFSIDPQNIVDMTRAVSGVSATMGAPESLHRQFEFDHKLNGQIRASMVLRLCRRAQESTILKYDPASPEKMLNEVQKKKPISAIIDGSGAFKTGSHQIAEKLLETNSNLQQVGYHEDGKMRFAGTATGKGKKTGFFFKQANTRGSDVPFLDYEALAVLTLSDRDGLREYFQKEGRLRQDSQRYQLALSQYQENINSVQDEIGHAVCNDAQTDAQDIFKKSKQEFAAIIRKAAKDKLLALDSISEFVKEFSQDKVQKLFITPKGASYSEPGSYFEAHKHIQREDQPPLIVLTALKEESRALAEKLDLPDAVSKIDKIAFSESLLAKMPKFVAAAHSTELEMEHEVEVEKEKELEKQLEIQIEAEREHIHDSTGEQGNYPLRKDTIAEYKLAEISQVNYDSTIEISDSFLPLSRRNTAALRQRYLFDPNMYRVGIIFIEPNLIQQGDEKQAKLGNPPYKKIIIEDPLEDTLRYGRRLNNSANGFFYDIRTHKVVTPDMDHLNSNVNPTEILSDPKFKELLAQIKFFDGQTGGYDEEETQFLAAWLKANDPIKMQGHLLNTILRYRFSEKLTFEGSQLEEVFQKLTV